MKNIKRLSNLKYLFSFLGLFSLLALFPQSAAASGHIYGIPGTPLARGGMAENISNGKGSFFSMKFEEGKSYACTVVGGYTNGGFTLTAAGVPSGESSINQCGGITPEIRVPSTDPSGNKDNRLCVISHATGGYVFNARSARKGGEPGRFECVETTLYGGFNTNANEFNFLELVNTTNTAIEGKIYAVNYDGTVVINAAPFTVEPNRRFDVSVHDSAGVGRYGLIRVAHNGPDGAIQATVSQYKGPVSDLSLAGSMLMRPREQNM